MLKRLVLTTCILLIINSIAAQQLSPIETDRPDQTETPFLTPKGWLQFEGGLFAQKNNAQFIAQQLPTLLSKYAVSKKLEFRLITTIANYKQTGFKSVTGLEPIQLGAKIPLLHAEKTGTRLSLVAHVAVPFLASKNLQANLFAPNARLLFQQDVNKIYSVGANFGFTTDGEINDPVIQYTIVNSFNLTSKIGLYVEVFGDGIFAADAIPAHSFDGGLTYLLNNDTKLDISAAVGLNKAAPKNYFNLGFSTRLKL
jgi:Putative MetA-pathway of phenol degradation